MGYHIVGIGEATSSLHGSTVGAGIPEELEKLLEDASVVRDTEGLRRLVVDGAVVEDVDRTARGIGE